MFTLFFHFYTLSLLHVQLHVVFLLFLLFSFRSVKNYIELQTFI